MDTEELLGRARDRLEGVRNAQLPPRETLSAILRLGDENTELAMRNESLTQENELLKGLSEDLRGRLSTVKAQNDELRKYAEQKDALSMNLVRVLEAMYNREYEGKERQTAKRVIDANVSLINLPMPG